MKIKVFADCADLAQMVACNGPLVKGFTTNPSLMRKAGITSYYDFAHKVLQAIPDKPVSFEVFADNFHEMEQQARFIAGWGNNVYVKVPVMTTYREFTGPVLRAAARGRAETPIYSSAHRGPGCTRGGPRMPHRRNRIDAA